MAGVFHCDRKFENLKYTDSVPEPGDYENCTFLNCDFTNANLSDINFLESEFIDCNLSLAKLTQTSLIEVRFKNCKLLGLHFEDCNNQTISVTFDGCMINLCSFNKLKLKKSVFVNSRIYEVDFSETDLTRSEFKNCDLQRTIFHHTDLEGADFRTSFNYIIDPESNRIRRARFSVSGISGLLNKYDIEID